MDGAENISVLPGMEYTFCAYTIPEGLARVAFFYTDRFADESGFQDFSTDELFSIAFENDGFGVTITAEADVSREGYVLVDATIAQSQR